jgi:predicted nuclease of predicted toxin-antitoxin system
MSDQKIWDYACAQGLIILTKDADFYTRCVISPTPDKVIHFQFGNYTLHQLHLFFSKNWNLISEMIDKSTLLIVSEEEIKAVL